MALCAPDEGPATDRLIRDQRGLKVVTYPDDPGVEFHLSPGDWIATLGRHGFASTRCTSSTRPTTRPRPGTSGPRRNGRVAGRSKRSGPRREPEADVLGPDDAGEILTLQRAAYVGEAMLYDQFLPPLHETLEEIRAVLQATTRRCSASATTAG